MFLSFLSFGHLKKFGQLYLLIFLVMIIAVNYARLRNAQANAIEYKSELSICSNHLEVQNTAIQEWRREGEELKNRIEQANLEVEKLQAESDKGLQEIINTNFGNTCEGAVAISKQFAISLQ
jgi:hypothetical protein